MKKMIHKQSQKIGIHLGIDFLYFAKNGSWVLARQFFVAIFSLLIISLFSHFVNQEVFGKYQLVLSVVSVVMIFSLPGIGTALVQSVARKKDGFYKDAFQVSLRSSLLGSIILFLIGIYFFWTGDFGLGLSFLIMSVAFPFLSAFGLWESFLQGQERFDVSSKNASFISFVQAIFIAGVIIFFTNYLVAFVIAYAISISILNIYFYQKSKLLTRNNENDKEAKEYGFFITKMSIWGLLSEQIDKILIGLFIGPTELAIYTIVSFFGIRTKDIVRSFSSMLVPKMTVETNSFLSIFKIHKKIFLIISLFILFGTISFYFFVGYANSLMFASSYQEYAYLSQWYAVTILLSVPLTVMGYYIYARKNTYALKISNMNFHILRIGINAISIYSFGLSGAVIAYNLSMFILLFFYLWGIYHEEKIISLQ